MARKHSLLAILSENMQQVVCIKGSQERNRNSFKIIFYPIKDNFFFDLNFQNIKNDFMVLCALSTSALTQQAASQQPAVSWGNMPLKFAGCVKNVNLRMTSGIGEQYLNEVAACGFSSLNSTRTCLALCDENLWFQCNLRKLYMILGRKKYCRFP